MYSMIVLIGRRFDEEGDDVAIVGSVRHGERLQREWVSGLIGRDVRGGCCLWW